MKKNKLLVPILAVAGLGATIAPVVIMTSCGGDKGKKDQGTVITKTEFNTLLDTIKTNFVNDADHKYFTKDEIQITLNDSPLTNKYISEVNDYNGRNVLVRYDGDEGNGKYIDCGWLYSQLDMIPRMGTIVNETYTKYNDSIKAQITFTVTSEQTTIQGTCDTQLYNNGFIKYYHNKMGSEGNEAYIQNIDVTYTKDPHSIDTFVWGDNTIYPGAYLKQDKQYTIKFTPQIEGIKSFSMTDSVSNVEFDVDTGIDGWSKVGAAYTSNTPLTKGQQYTIVIHINNESKYVFLNWATN